ncbi:hypothetical protein [Pseudomonas sp. EA_35y_Pfl2_R5]|uniref:hypothetical protein n=1 Tax=Pseudomonas sp. EA_35y_Pfl2_R5 TaxID=3088690 RepID=UPI0030DA7ADE
MNMIQKVAIAIQNLLYGQRLSIKAYRNELKNHQVAYDAGDYVNAESTRNLAIFTTALMIAIIPLSTVAALLFYRDFATPEKLIFSLISIALLYSWLCIDAGKVRAVCEILESRGGDNEQN